MNQPMMMGSITLTRFLDQGVKPDLGHDRVVLVFIEQQKLDRALGVVAQPGDASALDGQQAAAPVATEGADRAAANHHTEALAFRNGTPGDGDGVLEIDEELLRGLISRFGASRNWDALQWVHKQDQGYVIQPVRSIKTLPLKGAQG